MSGYYPEGMTSADYDHVHGVSGLTEVPSSETFTFDDGTFSIDFDLVRLSPGEYEVQALFDGEPVKTFDDADEACSWLYKTFDHEDMTAAKAKELIGGGS